MGWIATGGIVSTCVQENDGLVGSILKILEESVQIDVVVVVVAVAVLVVGFVAGCCCYCYSF